jgi:hypothetical protein
MPATAKEISPICNSTASAGLSEAVDELVQVRTILEMQLGSKIGVVHSVSTGPLSIHGRNRQ